MAEYVNFFETLKEAEMRLRGTIVLYDGEPYYVWAITNHNTDGIFRIYLDPISSCHMTIQNYNQIPSSDTVHHSELGSSLDQFLTNNPKAPLLRKMMNSPKFNKFRPFPLGMCYDSSGTLFYLERQPTRRTEQGLTNGMLLVSEVTIAPTNGQYVPSPYFNLHSDEFRACVLGEYPTPTACLAAMRNPKVKNNAAAFHREFALVRGPLGTLYLAYRTDVIGVLPNLDFSVVTLGQEFPYTREVVESLQLFLTVNIQN